jgi:hypothetical protein
VETLIVVASAAFGFGDFGEFVVSGVKTRFTSLVSTHTRKEEGTHCNNKGNRQGTNRKDGRTASAAKLVCDLHT